VEGVIALAPDRRAVIARALTRWATPIERLTADRAAVLGHLPAPGRQPVPPIHHDLHFALRQWRNPGSAQGTIYTKRENLGGLIRAGAWNARNRDDIADIANPANKLHKPIESESESSVRNRPEPGAVQSGNTGPGNNKVPSQIKIPIHLGLIDAVCLHRLAEGVGVVDPLAAADDFADSGHEQIQAGDGALVVYRFLHVEGLQRLRVIGHKNRPESDQ
jgi:hypothetical protein